MVVDEYVQSEVAKGNIFGPFDPVTLPSVHTNRFGVIPKKHKPGSWRLITDLSYPAGRSVNDAINKQCCSMKCISVIDMANAAVALGRGTLIAKIDIKAAYRLVPVCPEDRQWLPFGLRSAPKNFNALADALECVVAEKGVEHLYHYLDDFAMVGPPDSAACHYYLNTMAKVCHEMACHSPRKNRRVLAL